MPDDRLDHYKLDLCERLHTNRVKESDLSRLLAGAGDPTPEESAKWVIDQMWREISWQKSNNPFRDHPRR
jgi:hypothetical protein